MSARLGKWQLHMLGFAKRHPNQWHSYALDLKTWRVVESLRVRGLIEVNDCRQFRLAKAQP